MGNKRNYNLHVNKEVCGFYANCDRAKGCDGFGKIGKKAGRNKRETCWTYTPESQLNLIRGRGIESIV